MCTWTEKRSNIYTNALVNSQSEVEYKTLYNILLFIDSPFRKLVLRFSISSETSGKLKNSWQSNIMSGEAVLNILNSTRFAEKFRDFSWAELSNATLFTTHTDRLLRSLESAAFCRTPTVLLCHQSNCLQSSLPGRRCPTLEQPAWRHRAGWFDVDLSAPTKHYLFQQSYPDVVL